VRSLRISRGRSPFPPGPAVTVTAGNAHLSCLCYQVRNQKILLTSVVLTQLVAFLELGAAVAIPFLLARVTTGVSHN
jgi:hypothetical protein